MTIVYIFKINKDFKKSYNIYLNEVPQVLQKNILKYRNLPDQYRSLAGKLLTRVAMVNEGYDSDILLKCKFDNFNRPYFYSQTDFNLSHSGDYVICAITDNGKLGVDIEKMELIKLDDFLYLFTESEIKSIENRLDKFYHLWTQKEALSKAIGKGLQISLKDMAIKNGVGTFETHTWNLRTMDIDENYKSHLAHKDDFMPEFHKVSNSELMIK